jgi:hypothetical protein
MIVSQASITSVGCGGNCTILVSEAPERTVMTCKDSDINLSTTTTVNDSVCEESHQPKTVSEVLQAVT